MIMEKLRMNQEEQEEEEEESSPLNLRNLSKLLLPPLGVNYSDHDLGENGGGGGGGGGGRRRKIISPMDSVYRCWETWMVCLVTYSAFVYPFQVAFLNSSSTTRCVTIVNTIVDAFFAKDIILTFFVAYIDSTTQMLVKNPNKIASRYLSSWFVMDVASTIPFNAIGSITTDKVENRFPYNLLWILRLWRLNKIHQYFTRLEKDIRFSYFLVRCTRLLFVTLFLVHCAGCGFYLMAVLHPHNGRTWIRTVKMLNLSRESSIWTQYMAAIYWSATTIANVGYGDIHAVNSLEMSFSTFCMLLNLGFTSYLIGNITNLVVEGTRKRTMDFRNNIEVASKFVSRNNLPKRLERHILTYMCLKFRAEYLNQQHLMDELPTSINKTICQHLFLPILTNVYLFKGVSSEMLLLLATEMKIEYKPPKENVINHKEGGGEIYIVVAGEIEIIQHQHEQDSSKEEAVGGLKAGGIFGEISVLCNRPQTRTFRTRTLSQLLKLNHANLFQAMKMMQEDGDVIKKNFFQQHAESVNFNERRRRSYGGGRADSDDEEIIISRTHLDPRNNHGKEESPANYDHMVINVRVSVFKCHPIELVRREQSSPQMIGKVITLPHTMEDLKNIIETKLLVEAKNMVLLNDRGAEVDSIEVIRDGDNLFCST